VNKALIAIGSTGLGAGLMYVLDPDRGNRRRAVVRDKTAHLATSARDAVGRTSRDLTNRLSGLAAGVEALFETEQVLDEVLVQRVRSKIGRWLSHPGSIDVTAASGHVTLSGPVLANEVDHLIKCVSSVRGVTEVTNRLEVHDQAGNVPGLQDGQEHPGPRFELIQANWSPTARLIAGATSGALILYGAKRKGLIGAALGTLGGGLMARALTNRDAKRLIGIGGVGPGRGIHIEKTINIAAPVEKVYDFWTHHEKFPLFMSHVREVKPVGPGRYHWKVEGPAGMRVEWYGQVTTLIPNKLLAWHSVPDSMVEQEGVIHFQPAAGGGTCVDIRMSYNPPLGAVGHAIATLFGSDPKKEMDDDLMRMKTYLETGPAPHDATEGAHG